MYANSGRGVFVLDDQASVVENASIREWSSRVFAPPANSPVAGRPIVNVSLAINYALGGLDPAGYHLWNLGVHVLCALVAFGLVHRTAQLPRVRAQSSADPANLATAIALLWVIHPVNTEVVDYVTQRTESMMALFFLLTLYAAARAVLSPTWRWQALAVVCCGLGMACKESMATAPVVVALYDRIYGFASWKDVWRSRRWMYAGFGASLVVLAALMASGPRGEVGGFSSGVPVSTYLLNQSVVVTHYLRLIVWPHPLVVFYGWPAPMTVVQVLPAVTALVALAAATMFALVRWPAVGFLPAVFCITLAPTSSIIPIATEVGAERRMYLPLLAAIALLVLAAERMGRRLAPERRRYLLATALAAVCLPLAVLTWRRNVEYSSKLTLAETIVERRPTAIAHHILGEQLLALRRSDEGFAQLRAAVDGGDSKAAYALGVALFEAGQRSEAARHLHTFLATEGKPLVPRWLEPTPFEVLSSHLVLARVSLAEREPSTALDEARAVIARVPEHVEGLSLVADALFALQRYEEAAPIYQKVASARPGEMGVWLNLGISLVATDRLGEAVVSFQRAVRADPRSALAHRLLGLSLLDSGRPEDARTEARAAVALAPGDRANRDLLAAAQAQRR